MEKINKIINGLDLKNQEKINISTWKKSTKYKSICTICKKEFEFEAIPKSKWDRPQRHFCSAECVAVYKKKMYQKRLYIIPPKFREIKCDKPRLVQEGIDQSLFITGNCGVGKTVLMAGVVKEILKDKEREVMWISYPELIMELQNLYKTGDSEMTPFDRAEEVAGFQGTLAIDDIGAEKITAFVQQITYFIINHREQYILHTLVTSNFSLQRIDEQIDIRISSRLAGMCKIIKLTGKDRRLQK